MFRLEGVHEGAQIGGPRRRDLVRQGKGTVKVDLTVKGLAGLTPVLRVDHDQEHPFDEVPEGLAVGIPRQVVHVAFRHRELVHGVQHVDGSRIRRHPCR